MKVAALLYDPVTQHVLCGLESYYCFEESDNVMENHKLHMLEYDTEEHAIQHAIHLSNLYQREIRYSEFQEHRTHYCCLTTNSHMGIIKGNGNPGEKPIHAIQREISEEVGVIIPEERLHDTLTLSHVRLYTTIYLVPCSIEERQTIEIHIEARRKRHCGELFHMAFRNLLSVTHPMNYITRMVYQWIKKHHLPTFKKHYDYPITYVPLLPFPTGKDTEKEYEISFLEEPPFVWGKKRKSLLPLPLLLEKV